MKYGAGNYASDIPYNPQATIFVSDALVTSGSFTNGGSVTTSFSVDTAATLPVYTQE